MGAVMKYIRNRAAWRERAATVAILIGLFPAASFGIPYELAFDEQIVPWHESIAVSPKLDWVAYSVRHRPPEAQGEPRFDGTTPSAYIGARMHILSLDNQASGDALMCSAAGNSWGGAWSHDGTVLAFYGDGLGRKSIWLYDANTGRCRELAPMVVFGITPPIWSPDGSTLFVHAPTPPIPVKTDPERALIEFTSDDATDRDAKIDVAGYTISFALVAIDTKSGESRRIVSAEAEPRPMVMRLSPSGKWISYLSSTVQRGVSGAYVKSLSLVSVKGGVPKVVATELPELWSIYDNYAWSPRHDQLVYWKDGAVWLVNASSAGTKPKRLAPELGELAPSTHWFTHDGRAVLVERRMEANGTSASRKFALVTLDNGGNYQFEIDSRWDVEGVVKRDSHTLWQPDADSVTVRARERASGKTVVLRTNLLTGEHSTIWEGHGRFGKSDQHIVGSRDNQRLYVIYEDLQTPAGIREFSADLSRSRLLATIDPRLLGVSEITAEVFETLAPDSAGQLRFLRTAVLLPPGAKRGDRLPAIVMAYPNMDLSKGIANFGGGINGNSIPNLIFSSRGYAVVLAHVTGAPRAGANDVIKNMVDDLLPQVYRAAELGYIDIQRLALSGQSYGGYATTAVVSQTNLFRAAVPINGIYDLPGEYSRLSEDGSTKNMAWSERIQGGMGTHPWDNVLRYVENSPYFRADKIATPLLIVAGGEDQSVSSTESGKLFGALRRLGKKAQLLMYPNEGHSVFYWSQASAVDVSNRIVNFLDEHLRPHTASAL
jgi:dipeptidyl aminopeptidase/acylaminoacyl peptidase